MPDMGKLLIQKISTRSKVTLWPYLICTGQKPLEFTGKRSYKSLMMLPREAPKCCKLSLMGDFACSSEDKNADICIYIMIRY